MLAHHTFDFLFAAQDASTSSIVWALAMLSDHPDIRDNIAAEWKRVGECPASASVFEHFPYTRAFTKEVRISFFFPFSYALFN